MRKFNKRIDAEQVEVNIRHPKLRVALLIFLITTAIVSIGYGVTTLLSTKPGWQEIKYVGSDNQNVSGDFTFYTYLRGGFMDQSGKQLKAAYSEAARYAFKLLSRDESFSDMGNLADINNHPNETVKVEKELCEALKKIVDSGDRTIYLGPVYEIYRGLFLCLDDGETKDFDINENPEIKEYADEFLKYCGDPEQVDLEILSDDQVMLKVSDDYLKFMKEMESTVYLDLFWMKNALSADILAEKMEEYGIHSGYLASNDGFIRCLDTSEETFYLLLTEWRDRKAVSPATLKYTGPASISIYRGYPIQDITTDLYYVFSDGRIVNGYVDPEDGLNHVKEAEYAVYGKNKSCLEAVLSSWDSIKDGDLTEEEMTDLYKDGLETVATRNKEVKIHGDHIELVVNED